MALPVANRLPVRRERDRLNREGKTYHSKFFTIVQAPADSLTPRFAILLSKKTAKMAVDRNRIKRVTSAILIELLPSFIPADYLIVPKSIVLTTPHSDLLSDLSSLIPFLGNRVVVNP